MFYSLSLYLRTSSTLRRYSISSLITHLNNPLSETDSELYSLIEKEKNRQQSSLVLIASENFTSQSVFDSLGSVLSNKYSEGYPGKRYYGGNENIDEVEKLCQKRALAAFHLDEKNWGVNVQSLSGSPANFQIYTALLKPHDRILSLDLPHGGHLSHGYQTLTKKISMVSKYFETMPYRIKHDTGTIDYDELEQNAELFRPKLIVAGASAYSRLIDYERIRHIAKKVNAYVLADIAHISGLMAAQTIPSCFPYVDVVMTTTHKGLRGPRGALIFFRKGQRGVTRKGVPIMYEIEDKINFSVFPGLQGGPHNHTIGAIATCLKQANSPSFIEYQQQVLKNSNCFAKRLNELGYSLVSGGTDNHLVLVNLKNSRNIDGASVERILELACIATNKNTIPGDKSAMNPGGIRMGTPALTSRGFLEQDFVEVANYFDRAVSIAVKLKGTEEGKTLKGFKKMCAVGSSVDSELERLKKDVMKFACSFPTIGFQKKDITYRTDLVVSKRS